MPASLIAIEYSPTAAASPAELNEVAVHDAERVDRGLGGHGGQPESQQHAEDAPRPGTDRGASSARIETQSATSTTVEAP